MLHNLTIQITDSNPCQLKSLSIYTFIYVCVCVKGLKLLKEKRAKHQQAANIIEKS